MSAPAEDRCVTCAQPGPTEQHHLAARSNDRALIVPLCVPCHRTITDWQWRLGVLRRETLEQRDHHGAPERAWALVEGFVILALTSANDEGSDGALALGRAAGSMMSMVVDVLETEQRWGPKPARRRGTAAPRPAPRGVADPVRLVSMGLDVNARLGEVAPQLARFAEAVPLASRWFEGLETYEGLAGADELKRHTDTMNATLWALANVASLEELLALGPQLAETARVVDLMMELLPVVARAETLEEAATAVDHVFGFGG
jgi:hypothetical protein